MALSTCKECKKEVSTEAKACPHCGVTKPTHKGPSTGFVIIILVLATIAINGLMGDDQEPVAKAAAPAPTPEQIAYKAKEEERFLKTVLVAQTVKKSLRDPESLVWEDMRADESGTVICVSYRAKNGFGGMNRGFVVMAAGTASQKAAAWNKHCTKPLFDMKHVRYAVD